LQAASHWLLMSLQRRSEFSSLCNITNYLRHVQFLLTLATLTDVRPSNGGGLLIPGIKHAPDQIPHLVVNAWVPSQTFRQRTHTSTSTRLQLVTRKKTARRWANCMSTPGPLSHTIMVNVFITFRFRLTYQAIRSSTQPPVM
jgi:hypothetical protein